VPQVALNNKQCSVWVRHPHGATTHAPGRSVHNT